MAPGPDHTATAMSQKLLDSSPLSLVSDRKETSPVLWEANMTCLLRGEEKLVLQRVGS